MVLLGVWCLLFGVLSCGVVRLLVLIVWCVELWCCLVFSCFVFLIVASFLVLGTYWFEFGIWCSLLAPVCCFICLLLTAICCLVVSVQTTKA